MALSPWPEAAAKMGLMLLAVTNVSERGIETIPSMGSYHLQPPSNGTATRDEAEKTSWHGAAGGVVTRWVKGMFIQPPVPWVLTR